MNGSRSRVGWALAVAAALTAADCAPQPTGEEPVVLETEDVGPGAEDVDLSSDRKGAKRSATAGQLPGSFPEGLPVYKPSTISDVGQEPTEDFVQLMSQHNAAAIDSWYRSALPAAGWAVESGPGGELIATRGRTRARITIQTSGPVTLVRIAY